MSEKKKPKRGRPTTFSKKIQAKVAKLARRGFTDAEIAELIDITEQTLNNWKKKHASFFESIKDWKTEADGKIEVSLYERACGYSHPEDKVFCHNGEELIVPTTKHYPPDPTSMIFWLKNRQPEKWRDAKQNELSTKGDKPIQVDVTANEEAVKQLVESIMQGTGNGESGD